jgi:hypothetical protein
LHFDDGIKNFLKSKKAAFHDDLRWTINKQKILTFIAFVHVLNPKTVIYLPKEGLKEKKLINLLSDFSLNRKLQQERKKIFNVTFS